MGTVFTRFSNFILASAFITELPPLMKKIAASFVVNKREREILKQNLIFVPLTFACGFLSLRNQRRGKRRTRPCSIPSVSFRQAPWPQGALSSHAPPTPLTGRGGTGGGWKERRVGWGVWVSGCGEGNQEAALSLHRKSPRLWLW